MFSGKSEELIRRLRRALIAKQARPGLQVGARRPLRGGAAHLLARRLGRRGGPGPRPSLELARARASRAPRCSASTRSSSSTRGSWKWSAILADRGARVIVAGTDMDFRGEPFGPMPRLLTARRDGGQAARHLRRSAAARPPATSGSWTASRRPTRPPPSRWAARRATRRAAGAATRSPPPPATRPPCWTCSSTEPEDATVLTYESLSSTPYRPPPPRGPGAGGRGKEPSPEPTHHDTIPFAARPPCGWLLGSHPVRRLAGRAGEAPPHRARPLPPPHRLRRGALARRAAGRLRRHAGGLGGEPLPARPLDRGTEGGERAASPGRESANEGSPVFSPDGTRLAFTTAREGRRPDLDPPARRGRRGVAAHRPRDRRRQPRLVARRRPYRLHLAAHPAAARRDAAGDAVHASAAPETWTPAPSATSTTTVPRRCGRSARSSPPTPTENDPRRRHPPRLPGRDLDQDERYAQIYVAECVRQGAKARRLTGGVFSSSGPSWSPDGRTLLYSASPPTGRRPPRLRAASPTSSSSTSPGGEPRRISEPGFAEYGPGFTADGRHVVYVRQPDRHPLPHRGQLGADRDASGRHRPPQRHRADGPLARRLRAHARRLALLHRLLRGRRPPLADAPRPPGARAGGEGPAREWTPSTWRAAPSPGRRHAAEPPQRRLRGARSTGAASGGSPRSTTRSSRRCTSPTTRRSGIPRTTEARPGVVHPADRLPRGAAPPARGGDPRRAARHVGTGRSQHVARVPDARGRRIHGLPLQPARLRGIRRGRAAVDPPRLGHAPRARHPDRRRQRDRPRPGRPPTGRWSPAAATPAS